MSISFTPQSKLLFIGDSITDCDWRKCPEAIGKGFVRIVRDFLAAKDPASAPLVINRGISGNKIPDLQKRWERDVLEVGADVLNVFIGINDVWHSWVPDRVGCDIDQYRAGYRDILSQARAKFPAVKIVLCEPSVIWIADPPDANNRLKPYVTAVHEIAREFAAECVVPLHETFNKSKELRPDIAWTTDGVHPTSYGHMLIARTWLAATGLL